MAEALMEKEKEEKKTEKENYYRSERVMGSFYRSMPIPAEIKPEEIQAQFKDGVLEVRLPKPPEAAIKASRIPVK